MRKEIEALLQSEESSYSIAKGTGVPVSTILDLRNQKRILDNISFINAEKLYNYKKERDLLEANNGSLRKIYELKEQLNKSGHVSPSIHVWENKAVIWQTWKDGGLLEDEESGDVYNGFDEMFANFEEDEKIIEVDLGNGIPEYYHAGDYEVIYDRI